MTYALQRFNRVGEGLCGNLALVVEPGRFQLFDVADGDVEYEVDATIESLMSNKLYSCGLEVGCEVEIGSAELAGSEYGPLAVTILRHL